MVPRAVAMLLEAISAQDGHACSYGFRPGRRAHDAWHALRERCRPEGMGWMVEAEGSGYCDRIDRPRLQAVLRRRGTAGSIRRLIGTWLRAGVMADGEWQHPETGVVQGGVSSPVLATLCLHHGLDEWVERAVRPRMKGRGFRLRCADDGVIGCEREIEARKMLTGLPTRLVRVGRTMQPTQTA